MNQSKKIKWLSVSDVHLGNTRTPAEFILKNLRKCFFEEKIIASLDIFIIAGDFFDRLLEYNHPAGGDILLFIDRLLIECSTHNVKLRVLEGTPSHDNKQNKIFDDLYSTGNYKCDMKYVDTLSVEHIEEWGINVLYVPDKIRTTVKEVYDDTIDLLKSLALSKVDFCIMHGAFAYQLPELAKEVYIQDDWLAIVKHYIFVGHVHIHNPYKRILPGGSFDRIAHNEEKPKGFLMGTMNLHGDPKKDEFYFIENKNAKVYLTIRLNSYDVDENLKFIEQSLQGVPNDSFIRIMAEKDNPILSNMTEVTKINLTHHWTKDNFKTKEEEEQLQVLDEDLEEWTAIHIDKTNIHDIIMVRLSKKEINGAILDLASKFIKEAI